MKKWLNNYFDLSKREFNGLLFLLSLIIVLKLLPYIYEQFMAVEQSDMRKETALYTLHLGDTIAASFPVSGQRRLKKKSVSFKKFFFDPNVIGLEQWQELGLSAKQASSLLKYVEKGGRFRKVADLRKMYTISETMYQELAPYVRISSSDEHRRDFENRKIEREFVKAELRVIFLNTADSAALEGLRGIGPAFAKRILKYRERLGGFYKKEQLLEVFGLDSAKFEEIKSQLIVDPNQLRKIRINIAAQEDFKNHPYIRYKQVNALIQYRQQHGNYSNIADLNKVAILNAETIERLAPYLIFE